MISLRSIVLGLLIALASPLAAFAQCSGQAPASTYCGNPTGALALPGWKPFSGIPFPIIAGGTVVGNNGTTPATASALTNPVLGIPGTVPGGLGIAGGTSGTAIIIAQSVAGTPTLVLPNTSGTFAVGATSPLVLSATTGGLTCPTCVTSSGGGAITGTAPISVSAAGVVSINAPYTTLTASNGGIVYSGATNLAILAGTATARQMLQSGASAAPAWSTAVWPATTTINQLLYSDSANNVTGLATLAGGVLNANGSGVPSITRTPVLGLAGTAVGSIGFQNATSGTVTLQPVAGALGTVTINIPAAAGTMAVSATSPVAVRAAGNVTCTTCATTTNGGALSAVAPITLSAGGAIGITGVALTKTDDTNVTLTLGGSPSTALVTAASLTLGWTGQLAVGRGGTGIGSGTSGCVLYFSGSTTIASSAALGANQLVIGGGAGVAPSTISCATTTTLVHGGTPPTCSQLAYADIASTALATSAELEAGTASKILSAAIIYDPAVNLGTTVSGSVTWDFNTFLNATTTLTGNVTALTCSNIKASQSGVIKITQDGTGSRTMVAGWCSQFRWAGGVRGTLSTTASATDSLYYQCVSSTVCDVSLSKAMAN